MVGCGDELLPGVRGGKLATSGQSANSIGAGKATVWAAHKHHVRFCGICSTEISIDVGKSI